MNFAAAGAAGRYGQKAMKNRGRKTADFGAEN